MWLWDLLTSTTNWFYGITSGWLGDVPIATAVILYYAHSRCHITGCYRHGKFPFQHYKLCRLHHPEHPQGPLTHMHIIKLHRGK